MRQPTSIIVVSRPKQVMLATVMKGLLQYTKECTTAPSLINAPFLAKEIGIETSIDEKVCGVCCDRCSVLNLFSTHPQGAWFAQSWQAVLLYPQMSEARSVGQYFGRQA